MLRDVESSQQEIHGGHGPQSPRLPPDISQTPGEPPEVPEQV